MILSPRLGLCVATLIAVCSCHHGDGTRTATTYDPARAPIAPAQWTTSCDTPAAFPAGTRLTVRLNESIRLSSSHPGQHFTATVATPLRDRAGCAVVPRGALVEGTVVSVSLGSVSSVRLAFNRIDTTSGALPVQASLDRDARVGTTVALAPAREERFGYDAVLVAPHPTMAVGGGPAPAVSAEAVAPQLPVGTELALVLTAQLRVE